MIRALILFFSLLLVPSIAHAAPARNWANMVTLSKEGAYVIGNPAAKM